MSGTLRMLHVIGGMAQEAGGPAVALVGLVAEQLRLGLRVSVVACYEQGYDTVYTEQLRSLGVDLQLVGPCTGPFKRHRDLWETVRLAVSIADVVHCHGVWEEVHFAAARTARQMHRPYIIRPCGMLARWSMTQGSLKKRVYLAWRLRSMLKHAARVHFTSMDEREEFRDLRLSVRAVVIPNGVDLTPFRDSESPSPTGCRTVIFFGRLHPKKGPDRLLRAFAEAAPADWRLRLVGPAEDAYLQELKSLAAELCIDNRTDFAGGIYGPEKSQVLADAALFVLPSSQENFGIAVVEAMAAGTPALVSHGVNIWREVEASGGGEGFALEHGALVAALRKWTSDPARLQSARVKAREFAFGYDWADISRRVHSVYTKVLTKLTINVVTGPFLSVPPAPCGAVERIWADLAQEMASRGHRVRLYVRDHEELTDLAPGNLSLHRLAPQTAGASLKQNLPRDLVYAVGAARALRSADVTVTNSFWLPYLLPYGKPTVGKIHVHVARVPKGQMRAYRWAGAHRLAAVSSAIARWIQEEDPNSPVKVFPNPIDVEAFRPRPEEAAPRTRAIVYTGRIHPEKGLDILVKAWSQLTSRPQFADVELRLIGPWEVERGGGGTVFVESLQKLSPKRKFTLPGGISDRRELAAAIRAASVYVYPSTAERGEASPVAPLEAMACGVPVVVSDLPQYLDYLKPEENGFLFDHRGEEAPDRLCALFLRILTMDGASRDRLCSAAAAEGAKYSVAAIADLYLKDFHELTGRH